MAKVYLQSYRADHYQALNSGGMSFVLDCLKVGFFGRKKAITITFIIPYHQNSQPYFEHWDCLIKTQQQLK